MLFRSSVRPSTGTGRLLWHALGPKTIELIHEHVHVDTVRDDLETLVLDADLLKAVLGGPDPGKKGKEIDGLAREILNEKDLGQYFGHGLGHGLGALVHDTGRLSPTIEQDIEIGQVWTIEPGVYIEGFGGARIEDDVLITESGCDVLTTFPKHLIEIPC